MATFWFMLTLLILEFGKSDCLECKTESGPRSNEYCVFPFEFNGVTYHQCTLDYSYNGQPWCSTNVDSQGIEGYNWGFCPLSCLSEEYRVLDDKLVEVLSHEESYKDAICVSTAEFLAVMPFIQQGISTLLFPVPPEFPEEDHYSGDYDQGPPFPNYGPEQNQDQWNDHLMIPNYYMDGFGDDMLFPDHSLEQSGNNQYPGFQGSELEPDSATNDPGSYAGSNQNLPLYPQSKSGRLRRSNQELSSEAGNPGDFGTGGTLNPLTTPPYGYNDTLHGVLDSFQDNDFDQILTSIFGENYDFSRLFDFIDDVMNSQFYDEDDDYDSGFYGYDYDSGFYGYGMKQKYTSVHFSDGYAGAVDYLYLQNPMLKQVYSQIYDQICNTDAYDCALYNTHLYGNVSAKLMSTDFADCKLKCQQSIDCHYFSYDKFSSTCFLMDKLNFTMEDTSVVSGPKHCYIETYELQLKHTQEMSRSCQFTNADAGSCIFQHPYDSPNTGGENYGCFENNIRYFGPYISSHWCPSFNECHNYCNTDPGCLYWTWFESEFSSSCFLRTYIEGKFEDSSAISGPKSCMQQKLSTDCAEAGRIDGQNLPISPWFGISNLQECLYVCTTIPHCKFVTFDSQLSLCWLKKYGQLDTLTFDTFGQVSSPAICDYQMGPWGSNPESYEPYESMGIPDEWLKLEEPMFVEENELHCEEIPLPEYCLKHGAHTFVIYPTNTQGQCEKKPNPSASYADFCSQENEVVDASKFCGYCLVGQYPGRIWMPVMMPSLLKVKCWPGGINCFSSDGHLYSQGVDSYF